MLKNAFQVKFSSSDALWKVIINHDFSKEDRSRDFQLRQAAKLYQDQLNDENFCFQKTFKSRKTIRE